jgi:hypothetical protein
MKTYIVEYRIFENKIGKITVKARNIAEAYDKVRMLNVIAIEHEHKIKIKQA